MRTTWRCHVPMQPQTPRCQTRLQRSTNRGILIRMTRKVRGNSRPDLFCRTLKMSHDLRWRGSCSSTSNGPCSSFSESFNSTRRDSEDRWLWRLVGLGFVPCALVILSDNRDLRRSLESLQHHTISFSEAQQRGNLLFRRVGFKRYDKPDCVESHQDFFGDT